MTAPTYADGTDDRTVAESMLRSLADHGVEYVFSNFGTDHTPFIEAAAGLREDGAGDAIPEFLVCPHEFVALSAAHGYAVASGDPQAVLVHVDVGTQNLGAAMHNAHRANAPVFVIAGLSPVTDEGYPGSRDNPIHYAQDVFDQSSIVEEYCRWTQEYRLPADPNEIVRRGLERAASSSPGPVYLTAAREALEAPSPAEPGAVRPVRPARPAGPDDDSLAPIIELLDRADRPLVVTSGGISALGDPSFDALVDFAETVGAGVVEHMPQVLCFPRDHDLHVGWEPTDAVREADLLVVLESDVPWVPSKTSVPDDLEVVQIDTNPSKPSYPNWSFEIDHSVMADPAASLRRLTERVGSDAGGDGDVWRRLHRERRAAAAEHVAAERDAGHLDAAVLSDAISEFVDRETIVLQGTTTNRTPALEHIP
ncbi:thiamine pyrophosphate-binding protein, partial [Halobellus sp. GM3]|uniref:thiamine pyrophosphate-binding protein n=1 Tax=Halobellus sp. GM3 TaxID=3458410 RepID=UPI00403DFA5F